MTQLANVKTIPDATYRLQFNNRFTFAQATTLVPYLHRLGISHCYASPYLKARPGSMHGYDIVDHNALNPEIGSEADYQRFVAELHRHRMGLITDIVPNHMGIMGSDNNWWLDILENGPASSYAAFFDIDWHPVKKALQNKLMIPVLGDHYGNTLEQGELTLKFDIGAGEFSVYYYQHRFPIDPRTYPFILNAQHPRLLALFAADDPLLLEYQTLDSSFSKLPDRTAPAQREDRNRDKEVFKRQLAHLCNVSPLIHQFINHCVVGINKRSDQTADTDKLHILLECQAYRLAYWRVAGDEINYRRFFDINELAGLRVEEEQVFNASHAFILSLIEQGNIQGLRIDHADGLHDPAAYNQRLNDRIAAIVQADTEVAAPPVYIVAEKIVANYEYLSHDWPIHGTTGYEFATTVNGVFIDAEAEKRFTAIYHRFVGRRIDFEELVYRAKKQVMTTSLAAELNVLANRLSQIAEAHLKTRDYTLNALRGALLEVVACFPVYRTYINSPIIRKEDAQYIEWAIAQARRYSHAADESVFDFIQRVLLIKPYSPESEGALIGFVKKFQQYTSPVMAKGHEDTALYQYHRLITLNEVGGDPRRFGYSVNAFHFFNQERAGKWPHAMLNLSTHDSKHGADVRARINVLTEIPQQWQQAVFHWHRLNHHARVTGSTVISRNDEYLLYQILLGTWPFTALDGSTLNAYRERIRAYMIKAVREAKQYSSWLNPDQDYEQAVSDFVSHCLDQKTNHVFLADFADFEKQLRKSGLYNALAQTLLELTSPGVPDIYQGNETWQFSLVDPDNRRPVDFDSNKQLLTDIDAAANDRPLLLKSLLNTPEDGRIKLFLTAQILRLRRQYADLFENGEYLKLTATGPRADNLLAFARRDQHHFAVIVVPRLMKHLWDKDALWAYTRLELPADAPRHYNNILTAEQLSAKAVGDHLELNIEELLGFFPVALLRACDESN